MNLFFFGSSERQLLGAYHAPAADLPARGSVLLCPPWGPEYYVAHRTLRHLAARLADSGYHVLRFDYHGTGDSSGQRDEGDLASWLADATVALDELLDVSGDPRMTVIGVRLGAIVAWRLSKLRPTQARTIVLWDPVIDGHGYLDELRAAQAEVDRWSLTSRPPQDNGLPVEVLGTPLPPAMIHSIGKVTLDDFRELTATRVLLFFSHKQPGNDALCSTLQSAGAQLHMETIPGQTAWREETLMQGRIPNVAVEHMVEALR